MTEKRLSLGINVSILLILTIFGVLLFLPLRLLFDTNYSDQDPNEDENNVSDLADSAKEKELMTPMDYRRLKRCPNLRYKDRLMSVFLSDYDENCMYKQNEHDDDEDDDDDDSDSEEEDSREDEEDEEKTCVAKRGIDEELKENAEEILKTRQMKSITVAGHILVTMLLVSVIAALIEVLRIRFAREKDSSRAGTIISRRCSSSVDQPATRRPILRELIRSQRSFEIPGTPRSALRLLGARPPPLIRRSSFPTPQAKQVATSSVCGTPSRLTRRPSAESEEDIGIVINALHHRTRLIRRH
ncbi:mating-type protein A-alpha Z4-like [Camponotus floridanus]|uniref:mating-type protein A-alpha Z4-like n=1 Tax=Camponotus floridanus TaxID=104421 RepID=UPI00059D8DC3|nr:mating-type protein A-alpha Z4-like [Camponotus floridanus]XP_019884208.1 mating-type protein A-alpha Z4-like [Camponotus floridanus]